MKKPEIEGIPIDEYIGLYDLLSDDFAKFSDQTAVSVIYHPESYVKLLHLVMQLYDENLRLKQVESKYVMACQETFELRDQLNLIKKFLRENKVFCPYFK